MIKISVKKYTNITPEEVEHARFKSDIIGNIEYGDVWYGFEKKAFPTKELLEQELESRRIQLEDEAKSDLRNIALSKSLMDQISMLFGTGIFIVFNYFGQKFFVFRK